LASLRTDHPSVPANPLIADPLYLARYIEKAGSGTQRMIELCVEAGLPEPTYEQRNGSFVLTLWRDWLTQAAMASMGLTERQRHVVAHVKARGRIGNLEYCQLYKVSKPTASRDLDELCRLQVLKRVGTTGKGTYYVLKGKGLTKGSSKAKGS